MVHARELHAQHQQQIARKHGEELLIDGRNRLRACEIAGVEPRYETLEFKDDEAVKSFVKSRSERAERSKGQRAMGHALLWPEAEKGGARKKGSSSETKLEGVSKARLSQARAILAHSPELALAGDRGSGWGASRDGRRDAGYWASGGIRHIK
jgi:hypothetical protein